MIKMTKEEVRNLLERTRSRKRETEEEVERLVDAAKKIVRKR